MPDMVKCLPEVKEIVEQVLLVLEMCLNLESDVEYPLQTENLHNNST